MIDLAKVLDSLVAAEPYPVETTRVAPAAPRCCGMSLPGMAHPARCNNPCEQIIPRRPPHGEPVEKWIPVYFTGLCATCSRREQDMREERRQRAGRAG